MAPSGHGTEPPGPSRHLPRIFFEILPAWRDLRRAGTRAGFGLFSGNVAARTVAVSLAVLSAVANFLFMPAFTAWALTVIAIDVLVIYALTAHGHDVA